MKMNTKKVFCMLFCCALVFVTCAQSDKISLLREQLEKNAEDQACTAGILAQKNTQKRDSHLVWSGIGGDEDVAYKHKVDELQKSINTYAAQLTQLKEQQKKLEQEIKDELKK
jgi:hypothetical protein